jgi:hypothetical protein
MVERLRDSANVDSRFPSGMTTGKAKSLFCDSTHRSVREGGGTRNSKSEGVVAG